MVLAAYYAIQVHNLKQLYGKSGAFLGYIADFEKQMAEQHESAQEYHLTMLNCKIKSDLVTKQLIRNVLKLFQNGQILVEMLGFIGCLQFFS